jgi:hypothetical protein
VASQCDATEESKEQINTYFLMERNPVFDPPSLLAPCHNAIEVIHYASDHMDSL